MGKKDALTHNDCRAKVCVWCAQYKKGVRKITTAVQTLLHGKIPEYGSDDRLPTGICDNCRKALQKEDSKHVLPPPYDYG